jgi:tRNA-modifying protein YgfZ
MPEPGAPVTKGAAEVGTMRSGRDGQGLALLRLDALDGVLACVGVTVSPRVPSWFAPETSRPT